MFQQANQETTKENDATSLRRRAHRGSDAGHQHTFVLAVSGTALAASPFTKITGGNTTLTLSSAASSALSNAHITATPIAPATASGSTFTFPIAGGKVNIKNLHGVIRHKGGFKLTDGTKSGAVRSLTVEAYGKTADLYGVVRGGTVKRCRVVGGPHHRRILCRNVTRDSIVRLAHITGVKLSGSSATGTAALTSRVGQAARPAVRRHDVQGGSGDRHGRRHPDVRLDLPAQPEVGEQRLVHAHQWAGRFPFQ